MIIIGGKLLKTFLLILMSIAHRFSLLLISYVLMSTYRGGMDRVVIGSIWVFSMYVAMKRNPDNGEDIQNAECGQSGIIMQLRIVNSVMNEADQEDDEYNLPQGTKMLK